MYYLQLKDDSDKLYGKGMSRADVIAVIDKKIEEQAQLEERSGPKK